MGTLQSWRKAYGALKDHTTVGLAQINSDYKDLDVAIVKATNHVECAPKERHLRKIFMATSAMRPRADVAYCIHALARRLAKTHNWTMSLGASVISGRLLPEQFNLQDVVASKVALKTLIVIHRALREGDPTFREELLNFHLRGRILQIANFKDDSTPVAWDYSAWVRTYALFLEERLECFKILKYDIEAERLPKPSQGQDKGFSRTRELESEELLDHLPALQQLLYRLIGCRPEGAAAGNYVVQYALALVLKESFKIYCAINDGIINLVDKFFEMPRHEAIKALDIYRRAGQQAASLSDFYEACKGLELARNFQFPVLREPPQSFLVTMEEYIREAPRTMSVPRETLEYPERLMLTYKPEGELSPTEDVELSVDEPKPVHLDDVPISAAESSAPLSPPPPPPPPPNHFDTGDLLGLNSISHDASVIEESNALALAIVTSGTTTSESNAAALAKDFDPTGWELALVTAPSSNLTSAQERELAGGFDSLTLNSLYDDAAYRGTSQQSIYGTPQQGMYGTPAPNPFGEADPFGMSHAVPPPTAIQMASSYPQHQMNPFGPAPPAYLHPQQPQHFTMDAHNPFGNAQRYNGFPAAPPVGHHPQTTNPFGSTTGLL